MRSPFLLVIAITARAASDRVSVAALAAKEKTAATEEKVAGKKTHGTMLAFFKPQPQKAEPE